MRRVRRLLDFLLSRLFFVTLLGALFILVFYLAMNTANIWILVDEGLDARAGVVLLGNKQDTLTNYFREEFLAQDPILAVGTGDSSPYRDYTIRSYRHNVRMLYVWSWPWESTARAEIIESVPYINGTIKSDKRAAALSVDDSLLNPPAWETRRYQVTLVRTAGRWKISALRQVENR